MPINFNPTTVAVSREGDCALVEAAGDFDLTTAEKLSSAVSGTLPGPTTVIVDLSRVAFLDSSGISALLQSRRMALRAGAELRIRGAHGIVAQVLAISGVDELLAGDPAP